MVTSTQEPLALDPYPVGRLPAGVRSRFLEPINGLRMHLLEAGYESAGRPTVLLLHGFPELAWSWRYLLPRLAAAGFHVVAPDQRGYGRTSGWSAAYDDDLQPFRLLNLARDALGLVHTLAAETGNQQVFLAGHDFGSPVAAWAALLRPDVFVRVALMSAPFPGPPTLKDGESKRPAYDLAAELAALPEPRKHYQHFYCTREADVDLRHAPQGVHDLLRAYYHHKSADWPGNKPRALATATAEAMAEMPTYYIMRLHQGMAETVAEVMPESEAIAANDWLPDADLAVYTEEFSRTGFQGGLNWYRARGLGLAEMALMSGRTLDQPTLFLSGVSDWGTHQSPGALERMREVCTDLEVELVPGAGHWVQQEQPDATAEALIRHYAESDRHD